MSTQQFNPTLELQEIRQKQKIKRRKTYHRSCLAKYRAEIVALRKEKKPASLREIAEWLRTKRRLKINFTTVRDFIKKLPELQEEKDAKVP